MSAKPVSRPKHVPQRTCVACRRVQGKRSMVRLVRTADGVQVDPTGKAAGRGMYLHPNQVCWTAALKGGRIEAALRTKLSPENRKTLNAFAATLPAAEELPGEPDYGNAAADTAPDVGPDVGLEAAADEADAQSADGLNAAEGTRRRLEG